MRARGLCAALCATFPVHFLRVPQITLPSATGLRGARRLRRSLARFRRPTNAGAAYPLGDSRRPLFAQEPIDYFVRQRSLGPSD